MTLLILLELESLSLTLGSMIFIPISFVRGNDRRAYNCTGVVLRGCCCCDDDDEDAAGAPNDDQVVNNLGLFASMSSGWVGEVAVGCIILDGAEIALSLLLMLGYSLLLL